MEQDEYKHFVIEEPSLGKSILRKKVYRNTESLRRHILKMVNRREPEAIVIVVKFPEHYPSTKDIISVLHAFEDAFGVKNVEVIRILHKDWIIEVLLYVVGNLLLNILANAIWDRLKGTYRGRKKEIMFEEYIETKDGEIKVRRLEFRTDE